MTVCDIPPRKTVRDTASRKTVCDIPPRMTVRDTACRRPGDAANQPMATICEGRFVTVCGHLWMPLLRRRSNGFEGVAPLSATMLVMGCPVANCVSRPNYVKVAWFWRISNAEPVDNSS